MKKAFTVTISFILLVIISGGVFTANAQTDDNTPIYFVMNGDIWTYYVNTGQLSQESTWGYNEEPILSPDGTRFAYISMAQIGVQQIEQNGFVFDPIPTNIWIWRVGDTSADNAYRLVDQPANAAIVDQMPQNVIRRSSLAWSPNGQQLAWIEMGTNYGFQLVVYDFASNSQRVLTTDLPPQFGDGGRVGIHNMRWGSGGIAVDNFSAAADASPDAGFIFEQTISVYDPNNGSKISQTRVGTERSGEMLADFFWLENGQIGIVYRGENRSVLNPATGALSPTALFQTFSRFASNRSDRNYYMVKPSGSLINWNIAWTNGESQFFTLQDYTDNQVAISPSGDQLAYVDDALYVWDNGVFTRVPGTEALNNSFPKGIIWAPIGWRSLQDPSNSDPNCPSAPKPRMVIGGQGIVIPGLGNNAFRDAPGKNVDGSNEIGIIPPNGSFSVLAGPECVSGYNWWQVSYNGQTGWTAEGEAGIYWLEPR